MYNLSLGYIPNRYTANYASTNMYKGGTHLSIKREKRQSVMTNGIWYNVVLKMCHVL